MNKDAKGMYRLEIITTRQGLEPFIWNFFPELVPTADSENFIVYATKLSNELSEPQTQLLDSWVEEEIIVAYKCSESDKVVLASHLTPVEAAAISGYSEAYWRKQAWLGLVPGARKPGKQWLLPRLYVEAHKKVGIMKKIEFTFIPLSKRPTDPKIWQVLVKQAAQGQATLFQDGESYFVQFPDEPEPIPFEKLAYNSQLGLYDKRQFPDILQQDSN